MAVLPNKWGLHATLNHNRAATAHEFQRGGHDAEAALFISSRKCVGFDLRVIFRHRDPDHCKAKEGNTHLRIGTATASGSINGRQTR